MVEAEVLQEEVEDQWGWLDSEVEEEASLEVTRFSQNQIPLSFEHYLACGYKDLAVEGA